MKSTDLRAKARAIFGSAIAEPMPNQPNGAKALQQRANARPIPTYKVGGVVKSTPPGPTAAEREEARRQNERLKKAKVTPKEGKVIDSANRSEGSMYKKGGMAKGKPKDGLAVMIAIGKPMKGMKKPVKKALGGGGNAPRATGKGLSSAPSQGYYSGLTGREQHGIKRAEKTVAPRMGAPVKKALGGGMDAKLSRAITGAKADMARMDQANVRTLPSGGLGKSMGRFAGRSVAPERMGAPVKRAVGGAGKTRKGMCK